MSSPLGVHLPGSSQLVHQATVSVRFKFVIVERKPKNSDELSGNTPSSPITGRWSDRSPLPAPEAGKPYDLYEHPGTHRIVRANLVTKIITATAEVVEIETEHSRYRIYLSETEEPKA